MVLECYEKIKTVRLAIRTTHTPNLDAIAHWLSDSAGRSLLQRAFPPSRSRGSTANQILQQCIVQYGTACVQSGLDYFERHFNSSLKMYFQHSKLPGTFHP